MIESPEQVIGDSLDIEFAEASEDAFAFFGDAIAISILQPASSASRRHESSTPMPVLLT